jgi:FHA domain-containing protein
MMATCPDGHQSVATDYCDECGLSIGAPAQAGGNSSPSGGASSPTYGSAGEPCPNCLLPRQAGDTFCEGCGFPFDEEQTGKTIDQPQLDLEAELRKAEEAQRQVEEEAARFNGSSGSGSGSGSGTGSRSGSANQGGQSGGPANQGGQSGGPANQGSQADPELEETMVSSPPKNGGAPAAGTGQWIAIASADRAYYDSVVAEGEIDANAHPFPPYCPERRFELKGDTVRIGRSGKRGNVDIDLTGPPTDPGVSHLHAVLQQRQDGGWQVVDLESMNGTVLNDDTAPIPPNQAFPVEAGHRIHVGVWTTLTLIQRS